MSGGLLVQARIDCRDGTCKFEIVAESERKIKLREVFGSLLIDQQDLEDLSFFFSLQHESPYGSLVL